MAIVCVVVASGCGKKKKDEPGSAAPSPPPALAAVAHDAAQAPAGIDAGTAAASARLDTEGSTIDTDELEAIESLAAYCEGEGCNPNDRGKGAPLSPTPPFLAVKIQNLGEKAMADTGYLFIQTAKGWFVTSFLWSMEEGELQHAVKRMEIRDYFPGGEPELVIHLDRQVTESGDGPVMVRKQEIMFLCLVGATGIPRCTDREVPIVVASAAEDTTWRVEITPKAGGILERKAVKGTPPHDAVGTAAIAPP